MRKPSSVIVSCSVNQKMSAAPEGGEEDDWHSDQDDSVKAFGPIDDSTLRYISSLRLISHGVQVSS